MARTIQICDATLWFGEQNPGFSMSDKEKVEIAKQLDRLGVDVIETGRADDRAKAAIRAVAEGVNNACVSVMCDADAASIEGAAALLRGAFRRRLNVVLDAASADAAAVEAAVAAVKKTGCFAAVTLSGSAQLDGDVLASLVKAASGAEAVYICDDAGSCTPDEIAEKVAAAAAGGDNVAVLCANDLGLAAANVLAAVAAGAREVCCSISGVGPRAGLAALEEVVVGLNTRADRFDAVTNVKSRLLYRTAKLVSTVLGYSVEPTHPVVGDGVYTTEGIIKPETVGVFRNNLVLGKFSSRADFETRVVELGYTLSSEKVDEGYAKFMELTGRKKTVSDRDIEALVEPLSEASTNVYELANFVINSGTMIPATSTVILRKGGEEIVRVDTGSGPVDASFKAIDRITGIDASLETYALQSVTEGEDALGDAVVKVRWNDKLYTGRGISTDIVEASIRAYIAAVNKIAASL